MTKVPLMLAAFSIFAFASSALAQEYHGIVKKEHVRIQRPQLSLHAQAPMTSGLSDNGFTLHAAQNNLPGFNFETSINAQDWDPFPNSHRGYIDRYPLPNRTAAVPSENYAEAEQDYEAHTPFPGLIHAAWGASQAGFEAALRTYPKRFMDTGVFVGQEGLYTGDRPRVAVDNCQCDTAIPSDSCMRSRMQGFGTNVPPTVTTTTYSQTPWAMQNTPSALQNTPPAFSSVSMHHMR